MAYYNRYAQTESGGMVEAGNGRWCEYTDLVQIQSMYCSEFQRSTDAEKDRDRARELLSRLRGVASLDQILDLMGEVDAEMAKGGSDVRS